MPSQLSKILRTGLANNLQMTWRGGKPRNDKVMPTNFDKQPKLAPKDSEGQGKLIS